MEMAINAGTTITNPLEALKNMIISELNLAYDKNQNVMLSCSNDGCSRINRCTCDCNDGW